MKHLWEIDHPYYCTEGSYWLGAANSAGWISRYESWADFVADEGENDLDLNLLFRWDWAPGEDGAPDELSLFFFLQRKAANRSVYVTVSREQEPEVREWLKVRAEHMRLLWEPLLDAGVPA